MLQVKTYVAHSNIHGIGLFAAEDIKKDQITWKYDPHIDIYFEPLDLETFPELLKKFIDKYAVLSTQSNKYVLSCDDARFTNHSNNPNVEPFEMQGEMELPARAIRDIKKGEEITINYRAIDILEAKSEDPYLNNS